MFSLFQSDMTFQIYKTIHNKIAHKTSRKIQQIQFTNIFEHLMYVKHHSIIGTEDTVVTKVE